MCLEKLPSAQINLYCLSAEISKQQSYRCILHVQTLSTDCFLIITIEAGMSQQHYGSRAKQCTGSHTYTTTHRNKCVNVRRDPGFYVRGRVLGGWVNIQVPCGTRAAPSAGAGRGRSPRKLLGIRKYRTSFLNRN